MLRRDFVIRFSAAKLKRKNENLVLIRCQT
jgi:hypothetical protein